MKKLNNTTEDRHFLYTLLSDGSYPKDNLNCGWAKKKKKDD
jgi:hypothetical protein